MHAQKVCVSTIVRQLGIEQKRFEAWKKRLEAGQGYAANGCSVSANRTNVVPIRRNGQ